jgi:transposase InsO family protein
MAESAASMHLRMLIATWPEDAPRGAVSAFCEQHGVSRSWFYKIRDRARAEGAVAATQRARPVPKSSPNKVPVQVEEMAVRVRKELAEQGWDCGPISVHDQMLRLGMPAPSRATLARIFTAHGMVVPQPQKRPRASWRRFTYPAPNGCWQLDGTEVALADGSTAVALQVQDDHSRKVLASQACRTENARDAWTVVQLAISRHGVPQRFLTDNGTAFNVTRRGQLGLLTRQLHKLGVNTIAATPNHPQTCGKNERLHRTLKRWLAARPAAQDLAQLQVLLEEFEPAYNTERGHQALPDRCTPQQAWDATPAAAAPPLPAPPRPDPEHPRPRPAPQHTPGPEHTAGPGQHVQRAKVSCHGQLSANRVVVHVGSEHIGRTLIVVVEDTRLSVYDPISGALLRELTVEPGRIYYGSGRPRGKRLTRLLSTKT